MLKYAEQHEDPDDTYNPWSIRQTSIFQRVDFRRDQSHHIFVRLSRRMQEELFLALQRNPNREIEFVQGRFNVHILLLKTLNMGWRKYIAYLEEEILNMVRIPDIKGIAILDCVLTAVRRKIKLVSVKRQGVEERRRRLSALRWRL